MSIGSKWHDRASGRTSMPLYSNKPALITRLCSPPRVVGALFVLGFLQSVGALTLTTITTGWWCGAFYAIAVIGPCLPGLIVLGFVMRRTT